ncbi:MAG: transporter, ATP-binding protein [Thermoleophilia bacterium]|nr:transporter, ATP-binding protein [Thermoleophilia bacterium]
MAEIRLSGVNKVYPGGTHAVHDVDLHIADGEFMIMVGPSGCAKSTILRMIAGLETPTGGTVEIGGRVVNDVAPKDRDIAMVFQSYALYPHMTVRENMAFGLRLRRMPPTEIDQRVADAARILGLEQLLDRLPKAMSGGQRQRVAMGRAIVREPQAFLMDEPLSNLDAKLRVQMRTEIAKLHQRLETTTVYVTHDQVEAMTLGQRICILRKGVVQQVDTPFQVYQNPANVFVGGFMGSPGMNFMNGHLVLHDGMLYLQLGDQHIPVPASVSSRLVATTDLHGRGVIVGIRPEHMSMSAPGDAGAIPVTVELTEAMGAEVYAYFTAAVQAPDLTALSDTQATADTYVARLGSGTEMRNGEQIMLRPDMDELHLFDAQSLLTLLAPAGEADVRARQNGAAIQIATGVAGTLASPVAMPHSTIVQPLMHPGQSFLHPPTPSQPVIHLHQTIVQPEQPTYGTLAEPVAASAIASVFDQPVADAFRVEPLVVGAPRMDAMTADGGTGNPHAAAPPRSGFAARPMAPSAHAPHTSGPYANLGIGGSKPPHGSGDARDVQVSELGTPITEPAMSAPVAVPVEELVMAEAPVAEAPRARRGFAPRVIGAALTNAAPSQPVERPTTVTLDDADLDAAIDALEGVDVDQPTPIEGSSAEATPVASESTLGAPAAEVASGAPSIAPLRGDLAVASSGFRDALARIRTQQPAAARPITMSGGVLPPPLSLRPNVDAKPASVPSVPAPAEPAAAPEPMVVRPPTLPGITPPPVQG